MNSINRKTKEQLRIEFSRLLSPKDLATMVESHKLITDIGFVILMQHGKEGTKNSADHDGNLLYQMTLLKSVSILQHVTPINYVTSIDGSMIKNTYDPFSMFAIVRAQYEAFCNFNNIYIQSKTSEELQLKYLLWVISGLNYRQRFKTISQAAIEKKQAEAKDIEEIMTHIMSNNCFKQLDEQYQKNILDGIKKRDWQFKIEGAKAYKIGWHEMMSNAGTNDLLEGQYSSLSLNTHPSNVSVFQFGTMYTEGMQEFNVDNTDNSQITGSGSGNFTFNATPAVSGVNTVYTVYSSLPSCANSATSVIYTNPLPNFNVSTSSQNICPGTSVVLTAQSSNQYSYSWSGGGINQSCASSYNPCQVTATPTTFNTTYNVTATDNNGCTLTQNITINESSHPATINVPYAYQCDNGYVQYFNSVYVADGYSWSTTPANAGVVISQVDPYTTGNQYIEVDCSNATAEFELNLTTTTGNCSSTTSIAIKQCCVPPGHILFGHNNIVISNPLVNNGNTSVTDAYYTNTPGKITTYYVSGQLHLIGNSTIDGTTFIMSPGSSILVDGTLTISNSHIYACSDMWRGIEFIAYGGAAPVLNVTNSLIEDATYGVNMAYSNFHGVFSTDGAFKPVANLTNAWFNRCTMGVVADYDPLHPDSANNYAIANNVYTSGGLHFNGGIITANNCVFSCLNGITMSMVSSQNYNTIGLLVDKLHNYMYNPNFYTFCGIAANSTSLFDINGNQNVIQNCYFDNLVDGIVTITDNITAYTPPSNLNVYNCNFQRAQLDPASENYNLIANFAYAQTDAINHTYAIGGAYYSPRIFLAGGSNNIQAIIQTQNSFLPFGSGINFLGSQLNVGGASTATSCSFSASDFGVVAFPDGSAEVDINYNAFLPANPTTYPYSTKNTGIYLSDLNGGTFGTTYNITGNTFQDHYKQGINVKMLNPSYNTQSPLNISSNNFTISSNFTSTNNFSTNFSTAPEAISLTGYASNPNLGTDQYIIDDNDIENYELGITTYNAHSVSITNNTINLFDDAANYTHGITATNCASAYIYHNTIYASINNPWMYGQFGIFTENGGNSTIACNTIDGPDISLKCQGSNNITTIEGNTFSDAAISNFWMDYACVVGIQGSSIYSNGNTFGGNTNAFYAGSGTNGNLSAFYYRNTGNQIPVGSSADVGSGAIAIPLGSPYAVSSSTTYYRCALHRENPILNSINAKQIATDSIHVPTDDTTAVFGNQLDLYRALTDTGVAYYSANATLNTFMVNMMGSTQEKLLIADTLLANSNNDSSKIEQAIIINNSFVPIGKHDSYLQKVNNLYASFKKGKKHFTVTQLQNLQDIAVLCPYEYGEGIYKARALLSLYDTKKYTNSCEQSSFNPSSIGNRKTTTVIENEMVKETNVRVYPNPTQNDLFIDGIKLQDADYAEIQIYGTLGQLILKTSLNNDITSINVSSLGSGSYFYKVLKNNNVMLVDKLVILK